LDEKADSTVGKEIEVRALRQDIKNAGYVSILVIVLVALYFAFRGNLTDVHFVKHKRLSSDLIIETGN